MNSLGALICLLPVLWTLSASASEQRKLKVLTSFLPVYTFTLNVAGDFAQVQNLSTINASPHDFQFSPPDVQKVNEADLIVVNGLGLELETRLQPLLKAAGKTRQKLEISAGLEPFLISSDHDGHRSSNPHIWLDPLLATHCVTNILRGLQAADPAHAAAYATNAAKYVARLQALHRELEAGLAFVKGAPVVTHHDAFEYFARRYQLRVVGVVEAVPEVAPAARYLANLQRIVRSEHVTVIFAEENHSLKMVRQLAADLGVRVAVLDPLESGKPSSTAYEDALRANLKTIQKALAGYAPSGAR